MFCHMGLHVQKAMYIYMLHELYYVNIFYGFHIVLLILFILLIAIDIWECLASTFPCY